MSGFMKQGKQNWKGVDFEKNREKRAEVALTLRKQQQKENMEKRRKEAAGASEDVMGDSMGEETDMNPTTESNLPTLVQMLQDPRKQFEATQKIRHLLSKNHKPPINEIIHYGCVGFFVRFLTDASNPSLQFEAAWALTNIASGTSDQTQAVIDAGAIGHFVNLLSSPQSHVREQAVWALGNIAGDSSRCRDRVLEYPIIEPLLNIMTSDPELQMLQNATWTLSNLCRGKPPANLEKVAPALPMLANLINHPNTEVVGDACWALSYISEGSTGTTERIDRVLQANVLPRLIELLSHPETKVVTPALRTVGNIVIGSDVQTQMVINAGALPPMHVLLKMGQHPSIQKECCWAISNIAAGNKDQIQALIVGMLIPPVVNLLTSSTVQVKREAAWVMYNISCGGTKEQIHHLVQSRCIPPLCELLRSHDTKAVNVALDALDNILGIGEDIKNEMGAELNDYMMEIQQCGGLESMEMLQMGADASLANKAVAVLRKYFELEEMEEPADAFTSGTFGMPQQQPGGFNF